MLGLFLDAGVLVGLVMFLNEDSDSPGYGLALAAAVAIGLLTFVAMLVLAPLGWLALVIILPAAAAIAAGVLWLVFDVQPLRAAAGGAAFLVYKVLLVALMYSVAGS